LWAHSRPAAGPSDTGLDPSVIERQKNQIILNYKGKMVYKERNYWLVLTRTSLAGFNAPIDMSFRLRWQSVQVEDHQSKYFL